MERHCWLFLVLAGCGFDDFDKLITYETGVLQDGTVDALDDTTDTGFSGGGGGGGAPGASASGGGSAPAMAFMNRGAPTGSTGR